MVVPGTPLTGGISMYRLYIPLLSLALISALSACTTPSPKPMVERVFSPSPPQPARLQFLTSLAGARDIEPQKSAFEKFVTGQQDSEKRLDKPYGVAIHDGKIYVCDTNMTV